MINQVKLKIKESYQDDRNKGIVRFDSMYMRKLDIVPGSVVSIKGERKTYAIAKRAFPSEIGKDTITMDVFTRKNAKATVGDFVEIKKAQIKKAAKVNLIPLQEVNEDTLTHIKSFLIGRPVCNNDIISVKHITRFEASISGNINLETDEFLQDILSNIERNFFGPRQQLLQFQVKKVAPDEVGYISEFTNVEFENSSSKKLEQNKNQISYEDIGGLNSQLTKIRELVDLPLRYPEIFERLGIEPPKGILLYGPPGTGKTLIAKSIANETLSHFYSISAPEIVNKFYGESEKKLRDIFENAKKNSPSIIFIDEIDAIASKREESQGETEKRIVAQLLTLLDGMDKNKRVIVIAATNRPDALDEALRRPGRFDREIEIGIPKEEDRMEILKIHSRNIPITAEIDKNIFKSFITEKFESMLKEKQNSEEKIEKELNTIKKSKLSLSEKIKSLEETKKKINKELLEITQKIKYYKNIIQKNDWEPFTIRKYQQLKFLYDNKKKELDNYSSTLKEFLNKKSQSVKKEEDIELNFKKNYVHKDKMKTFYEKVKKNEKILSSIISFLYSNKDEFLQSCKNLSDTSKELLKKSKFSKKEQEEMLNLISTFEELNMLSKDIFSEAKYSTKAKEELLKLISSITHGFVGADLEALIKEAAFNVVRRYFPQIDFKKEGSISKELLEKLEITKEDFMEALKVVRPSALREFLVEIPNIKWDDIGGLKKLKQQLIEMVEWPIKNFKAFERLGIKSPKGILLYGPPGTGKTLLGKAVATETKSNFIYIKGPEIINKYIGESEKAIKKLFQKARQNSPCILFFDEFDSIAKTRMGGEKGVTFDTIVTQILTEMDGLEDLINVKVIAATNRPSLIDPALLRAGRFDKLVLVGTPDKESRKNILKIHTKQTPIKDKEKTLDELTKLTENYVGADIENLIREAGLIALRKNIKSKQITLEDFKEAMKIIKKSVTEELKKFYEDIEVEMKNPKKKEGMVMDSYL